ncbi:unnamed protein product, partial [Allacma fusca]
KSVSGSPKYPDISLQGTNLMPSLKSLDGSIPLSLASLNPSLLGLPNSNLKTEANMAEALLKANLLTKSVLDASKQMQAQQGGTSTATQLAQAAVAAQIAQRSNSTSSNCSNSNGAGNIVKKGGLLAVIDKLKSQHSVDDSKKDMSKV